MDKKAPNLRLESLQVLRCQHVLLQDGRMLSFRKRTRRVFRGFWAEAVLPALAIQAHMGKTVAKDVAPGPSDGWGSFPGFGYLGFYEGGCRVLLRVLKGLWWVLKGGFVESAV